MPGADTDDFVTENWKVSTIPVLSVPRGSTGNFLKVNLGFDPSDRPVVGYAGDNLEYVVPLDE